MYNDTNFYSGANNNEISGTQVCGPQFCVPVCFFFVGLKKNCGLKHLTSKNDFLAFIEIFLYFCSVLSKAQTFLFAQSLLELPPRKR